MPMDAREAYDLVVAGGGPAGLSAAAEAARAGTRVLVAEAKTHLGEGCRCAEYVPALLAREVEIPARVRRAALSGLETRLGQDRAEARSPGFIIERREWEKGLALEAAAAGALVQAGVRCLGPDDQGRIRLKGPEGETGVRARALVAADGGLSRVASSLGLNPLEGVGAAQLEVEAGPELEGAVVAFREDLFGYLWLFPKGRTTNLGLGGEVLGRTGLRAMLGQWHAEAMDQGLAGPSVLRRSAGFIPVSGPREETALVRNGLAVFLAGDAAGLTHPLTGAGIPQAVLSGQEAGRAAARFLSGQGSAPAEYRAALNGIWAGPLARARKRREEARRLWEGDLLAGVKVFWPLWPKGAPKGGQG